MKIVNFQMYSALAASIPLRIFVNNMYEKIDRGQNT